MGTADVSHRGVGAAPHERPLAPAPATGQDLLQLMWAGWPFADTVWPAPSQGPAPIRVEEMVDDGQVVVRAELPGVDPADVEVVVDGDVLTITAQRHEHTENRIAHGYRSEFRYGTSTRQVRLPHGTTAEVVSATYRDGVLEVRMPAPPPGGGARKVEVERG